MLIPDLTPLATDLCKIKEIPDVFFYRLEDAVKFDNSLFPEWLFDKNGKPAVFKKGTELLTKFKAIYDKFKLIEDEQERKKIISTYFDTNQIVSLCENKITIDCNELTDLHESIRAEIDQAFLYLYKNGLKYPGFEKYVKDTLKLSLKRFAIDNELEVCPFCGLEMMLQIEGQARLPLDHWLNKDSFPFSSINFENLIPIGSTCNSTGVKGKKNVLKDRNQLDRITAYYPYKINSGTSITIRCIKEPSIDESLGTWDFSIKEFTESEKEIFGSWDYIFNISERYNGYFTDYLLLNWKKRYLEFIADDELEVVHAQNIDEFKANLKKWKKTFSIKKVPASLLYRTFIDHLLCDAEEASLFGIVENFKSQITAGLIH